MKWIKTEIYYGSDEKNSQLGYWFKALQIQNPAIFPSTDIEDYDWAAAGIRRYRAVYKDRYEYIDARELKAYLDKQPEGFVFPMKKDRAEVGAAQNGGGARASGAEAARQEQAIEISPQRLDIKLGEAGKMLAARLARIFDGLVEIEKSIGTLYVVASETIMYQNRTAYALERIADALEARASGAEAARQEQEGGVK